MTSARSGGKVILLGEHAVVYGVPALAASIERGAAVEVTESAEATLELGDRRISAGDDSDLGRAFAALLAALGAPPLCMTLTLELPAGCGLGASAAMGVALARGVAPYLARPCQESDVLEAAMAWERVFHGTPSGVDAAAAAHGGCIQFIRGAGIELLALPRPLELVIAVAGPPASTRAMVQGVARIKERRPEVFQKTLDGIAALVKNARLCLQAGDLPGLGQLMNLNQMLLSGWHLSTEAIEHACQVARDAGALGAKITGAGGGGAIVALADLDPEPVQAALLNEGFECFSTTVRSGGKA